MVDLPGQVDGENQGSEFLIQSLDPASLHLVQVEALALGVPEQTAQRKGAVVLHVDLHAAGVLLDIHVHLLQRDQRENRKDDADDRAGIESDSDGDTQGRRDPQTGGRRKSPYFILPRDDDGSGAEKADPADDLGAEAGGVGAGIQDRDVLIGKHEDRRADGDQHVCHKSRRSVPDPAFRSEDPADAQREQDPEDDVCRTQSAGPRDFPEQELTGRHPEICSAGDGCLSGIRLIRQK